MYLAHRWRNWLLPREYAHLGPGRDHCGFHGHARTDAPGHRPAGINIELRDGGKPILTNDLWIAALCQQYQLPLLSRDSHFDFVSGIQGLAW